MIDRPCIRPLPYVEFTFPFLDRGPGHAMLRFQFWRVVVMSVLLDRRNIMLLALAGGILPLSSALGKTGSLTSLLGNASDNALDKLAKPGAFYADKAIRILLPGGKTISKLLNVGAKAGLTDGLVKNLNEAAGLAAGEAKPIFRSAINNISLSDIPSIATKGDGATRYLRQSAGDDLRAKIEPLIESALGKVGVFQTIEKLGKTGSLMSSLGLNRTSLTDSVSDQALNGIFSYIGQEEAGLRKNPLKILRPVDI
jgi:hypothetical protein